MKTTKEKLNSHFLTVNLITQWLDLFPEEMTNKEIQNRLADFLVKGEGADTFEFNNN